MKFRLMEVWLKGHLGKGPDKVKLYLPTSLMAYAANTMGTEKWGDNINAVIETCRARNPMSEQLPQGLQSTWLEDSLRIETKGSVTSPGTPPCQSSATYSGSLLVTIGPPCLLSQECQFINAAVAEGARSHLDLHAKFIPRHGEIPIPISVSFTPAGPKHMVASQIGWLQAIQDGVLVFQ